MTRSPGVSNLWKRLKVFVLCLVVGQSTGGQTVRAADDTGLLGARLAAVEKTHDFFTFFHLARTGGEALADHRALVIFKPTGEAFRPLVTLAVTTDADGVIERLRLEVARSFIDDTRQGIFAADLVKSFLASAGSIAAKDDLAALAGEIHAREMMKPGRTVISTEPTPTASKVPTAGYQTYAGKARGQTVANRTGSVRATLENKEAAGTATLEITLSPGRR